MKYSHLPYQDYMLLLLIPLGILFIYFYFKERDLDNIKNRTVGNGQYGSARWIKDKEKDELFERIIYDPDK